MKDEPLQGHIHPQDIINPDFAIECTYKHSNTIHVALSINLL